MARGDGKEGPHSELYRSAPWKRIRKLVLERDGYRCRIGGRKCAVVADEVDHIVPVSAGGAKFDPFNLRAACAACNRGRRPGKGGSSASAGDCPRDHGTVGMPPCPECGRLGPSREW